MINSIMQRFSAVLHGNKPTFYADDPISFIWPDDASSCRDNKKGAESIYDLNTVAGIEAIPVLAKKYNPGDDFMDETYYVLQRKATEHKKAGRMDCAIACLKKSNELSDFAERPPLLEEDYLRLVKYIRLTGDEQAAQREYEAIYRRHPEFKDKRISNLPRIKEMLKNCSDYRTDLVKVFVNGRCPVCSKYSDKIYSVSGKSKSYPKLPTEISQDGGFCPNCYISITGYYPDINGL